MSASLRDRLQRIRQLEQTMERSRARLKRAAVMFVDGLLDRVGYDLAREEAERSVTAAETELARLLADAPNAALPSLAEVLGEAGGWLRPLQEGSIAEKRRVLTVLVDVVRVDKIRRGQYRLHIVWTPTGERLRQLAEELETAA